MNDMFNQSNSTQSFTQEYSNSAKVLCGKRKYSLKRLPEIKNDKIRGRQKQNRKGNS